jgi:hypothetical protein
MPLEGHNGTGQLSNSEQPPDTKGAETELRLISSNV